MPRVLLSLSKYSSEVTSGAAKDTRSLRPVLRLGADWLRRRRIDFGWCEGVCGEEEQQDVEENEVRLVWALTEVLEVLIGCSVEFRGQKGGVDRVPAPKVMTLPAKGDGKS